VLFSKFIENKGEVSQFIENKGEVNWVRICKLFSDLRHQDELYNALPSL
jgi:hypothetical protein